MDQVQTEAETMVLTEALIAYTAFSHRFSGYLISDATLTGSNLAFSPLCIHYLLSLLCAGSTGLTHNQLLIFLGCSDCSYLTTLYTSLSDVFRADPSAKGGPHLQYAGGIWVDADGNYKKSFRDVADLVFKVFPHLHVFPFVTKAEKCRKDMNEWVEQKTDGHIKNLFPFPSINVDTRIALANGIYFKGSWDEKFEPGNTRVGRFKLLNGNQLDALFMVSEKTQFISDYDGFKVLKLPYEQGQDFKMFSFYIFLPDTDKPDGLHHLALKLSTQSDFLARHIPERKVPVGNFAIPKFKITKRISFVEHLKRLSIDLPFKVTGDFSEMVDSNLSEFYFYVSEIAQKCIVEVNEEGTEAAGMSGVVMPAEQPIDFVADHPFVFLIRDDMTGVVYFVGLLQNTGLAV